MTAPACPRCHGDGVVSFMPPGPRDPQRVEDGVCDVCHGSGVADPASDEWTAYHEHRKRTDPPPYGEGRDE